MTLTEHQVIRASAGSGKTFQLSNRFLLLLAEGARPDVILATTFTRKAAGEILARVLGRLAEAVLDAGKCRRLSEQIGVPRLTPTRAGELLLSLVRRIHRLRVGTMDSFFRELAGSHAIELGIPSGWTIADEVQDIGLRSAALEAVLEADPAGVRTLLTSIAMGESVRNVTLQISNAVDEAYDLFRASGQDAWHLVPRHVLLTNAELDAAVEGIRSMAWPKAMQAAAENNTTAAIERDWDRFLENGLSAKIHGGESAFRRVPFTSEMRTALNPLVDHARAVLLHRLANQTESLYELLRRFDGEYSRLKRDRQQLRFDDVTLSLANGETCNGDSRFSFRLDGGIHHLLVDEFQDTDPNQWRVLRNLAERVMRRLADRGSFFCVGDIKQSIYGFRGGQPGILESLPRQFEDLQLKSLDTSYRSSPVIVEAVNQVFGELPGNAALAPYSDAADGWHEIFQPQRTERLELAGHVCLESARTQADEDAKGAVVRSAADLTRDLVRACPGRTIGILCYTNQTASWMVRLLKLRGVAASGEGGIPLDNSPPVNAILSALLLADHPGHSLAAYHVANSPLGTVLGLGKRHTIQDVRRLAAAWRRRLLADGYGPTIEAWTSVLADYGDDFDHDRLGRLISLAYEQDAAPTLRPGEFVARVCQERVPSALAAEVRVMTIHAAKGLEFDAVVLPILQEKIHHSPDMVDGRDPVTCLVTAVFRYPNKDVQACLPDELLHHVERQRARHIRETLCKLYVAMTRAIHALHIVIPPSADNERSLPKRISSILRCGLGRSSAPIPPGTVLYESGNPMWHLSAQNQVGEADETADTGDIRLAPSDGPRRSLRRRSPSELEGGRSIDLAFRFRLDKGSALSRGSCLHAWFEIIEWLEDGQPTSDQMRKVATELGMAPERTTELENEFIAMLARPITRAALTRTAYCQVTGSGTESAVHVASAHPCSEWKVLREKRFAVRLGDELLAGSFDRLTLLFDDGRIVGADVLDFKTDRLTPGDSEALRQRTEFYRPQLEAYRRAAAELYGLDMEKVSARLLFVETDRICRLT